MLDPRYAKRENLPEWLCDIAAEHDVIGQEARRFALVSMGVKETEKNRYNCEAGQVKWKMVREVEHGFTAMKDMMIKEPADMSKNSQDTLDYIGNWLMTGPFAKTGGSQ